MSEVESTKFDKSHLYHRKLETERVGYRVGPAISPRAVPAPKSAALQRANREPEGAY